MSLLGRVLLHPVVVYVLHRDNFTVFFQPFFISVQMSRVSTSLLTGGKHLLTVASLVLTTRNQEDLLSQFTLFLFVCGCLIASQVCIRPSDWWLSDG